MKLVSYLHNGHEQLAMQAGDILFDMDALHPELPSSMNMFLSFWDDCYPIAMNCAKAIADGRISDARGFSAEGLDWLAPVPLPPSVREASSFLENSGPYGGLTFINHHSLRGDGELGCLPEHFSRLLAGPQVAVVISQSGRNIAATDADAYIAGMIILNGLQSPDMGPTKGRDFANPMGPWFVTLDELAERETETRPGHVGKTWDLPIAISINDTEQTVGNLRDMHWTFAELISFAALGADLFPGDIICSGPVTGFSSPTLRPGDRVSVQVDGLGILTNSLEMES